LPSLAFSYDMFFFSHSVAGAIFSEEQKDTSIELAFKYAVYKINKDRNILPKTTLVYDIQYVPDSTDSFRTSKKVCKSIENGVTAIFGK
jgi:glutamate receptor, ionotropic, invertebrate